MTTKGGPVHATTVVVYYLYQQAFQFFHAGYAAAVAYVLFVAILLLTLVEPAAQPALDRGRVTTLTAATTSARTRTATPRRGRRPSPWHLVLAPIALVMLAPLLWMLVTSVSTLAESRHFPPRLPTSVHWQNYRDALTTAPFGHWFVNTAVVSVSLRRREPGAVHARRLRVRAGAVRRQRGGVRADAGHAHGAVPGDHDPDAAGDEAPAPRRHPRLHRAAEPGHAVRGVPAAAVLPHPAPRARGGRPHRRRRPAAHAGAGAAAADGRAAGHPRGAHPAERVERLPVAAHRDPDPEPDDAAGSGWRRSRARTRRTGRW
nr:hypothetical protein [Angustibacter aerolatus]